MNSPACYQIWAVYETENVLMLIENIDAAGWNPSGNMDSLASISASDLIWQMDTHYAISYDRYARQCSAGCCHFEFPNKTSPAKFILSCTSSSRYAWICILSQGHILIKFTEMLSRLKTLIKLRHRGKINVSMICGSLSSLIIVFWPFSELSLISIMQTHNLTCLWNVVIH